MAFQSAVEPYFSVVYKPEGKPPQFTNRVTVNRLHVDNRDRTDPANTSPFDFVVDFKNVAFAGYENVVSAELKALAFPKVAGHEYVVMDIVELQDHMNSTRQFADGTFNIGYFKSSGMPTGEVQPLRGADLVFQDEKVFNPPIAKLERMTVRFFKPDANVVTSSDTLGNVAVSLCLEIKTDPALRRQMY